MTTSQKEFEFGKWYPIETAPRTRKIIVCDSAKNVGEACYYEDEGFYWANCCPSDPWDGKVDIPTHWMRLPPPPEGKE